MRSQVFKGMGHGQNPCFDKNILPLDPPRESGPIITFAMLQGNFGDGPGEIDFFIYPVLVESHLDICMQFLLIVGFNQITKRICLFCPFDIFLICV